MAILQKRNAVQDAQVFKYKRFHFYFTHCEINYSNNLKHKKIGILYNIINQLEETVLVLTLELKDA